MKNKKRRTGEEIKEHKRKAKADKVSNIAQGRRDVLMGSLTLQTI